MAFYGNRLSEMIKGCFPEYDWHDWLFNKAPMDFWDDPSNQRRYLEWLGRKLGFERPEDWYQVTTDAFAANRGITLLDRYEGSFVKALIACFPEHEWLEWRFYRSPRGFWGDRANRRRAVEWLGKQLRYDDPNDWYLVTRRDFIEHGLRGLLDHYQGSPGAAVADLLSEHVWKEWLFQLTPKVFWINRRNRRRYLEWLGEELGFVEPGDWTRLTRSDLSLNCGWALLQLFDRSARAVLLHTFPANHPVHRVIRGT